MFTQMLFPLIIVFIGLILSFFPSKTPSQVFRRGVNVPSAYKSQEQWDYAQKIGAHLMIVIGLIACVLFLLLYFLKIDSGVLNLFSKINGPIALVIIFLITEFKTRTYNI